MNEGRHLSLLLLMRHILLLVLASACAYEQPPGIWRSVSNSTQNECNPQKTCNVCAACCKSYIADGKECDDCVTSACPKTNECNPAKTCNVCDACCKPYIEDGKECNDCVKADCTGPSPAPVPPTPSSPTPGPVPKPTPGPVPGHEPNPPNWPSTVNIFTPGQSGMQSIIDAAFATNGGHTPPDHGAFSDKRYAFLFMPGTYAVDVPVGFYTTVHGLG